MRKWVKNNKTIRLYEGFFRFKREQIKRSGKTGIRKALAYLRLALITPWCLVLRYFRRNPRLLIWFAGWFLIVSSEVWVPYLLAAIGWQNEAFRNSMLSVGSACWLFWAGPGTPFMAIVLALSIASEAVFKKIKKRRRRK